MKPSHRLAGALPGLLLSLYVQNEPDELTHPYDRGSLVRRAAHTGSNPVPEAVAVLPISLAGIYGGYFGVGLVE